MPIDPPKPEPVKPLPPYERPPLVLLLLLTVPVIIFWRPAFFYILDDWTALIQMTEHPFGQYLVTPDGEQWFPFFHLLYYGLVKVAGERYSLLVLFNCLGTGVNAFLVYSFFRRRWGPGLALTLSLVYAVAAAHHAIAWNAFYVGYLVSLGLFLGALLLTDGYLRQPSAARLWGIGGCATLSILSHNYPLVGLLALPLYLLIMGDQGAWRPFWKVTGVIGAVYLIFSLGYLSFAGLPAAASRNFQVFSGLPGPAYLLHLLCGAWVSPFLYLFWGHYHFPLPAYLAGVSLLLLSLAAIWGWGGAADQRLALWALLLVGTAWRLLAARIPRRAWANALAGVILAVMVGGQLLSLPLWTAKYLEMSRLARKCYVILNRDGHSPQAITPEEYRKFCPDAYPTITPGQAQAIRRLLGGVPGPL